MEQENVIPDEKWEQQILNRMAEESSAYELLDLTQDCALRLAAILGDQRRAEPQEFEADLPSMLRRIARVAVMLDVLQLRFGDAVEEEIQFLRQLETVFE